MNKKMPVKAIQEYMQKNSCGVSKTKAFRAKAKAQVHLRGDSKVHYSLLRDYVQELKRCNPNTTIKINVYGEENPDSHKRMFRRIYICLGALKDGFRESGRELLCLDGAFMKGQKGLLPAIAKLFPAAEHRYCVRHIHRNINMTWKGSEYKEMLWNCATACTIVDFNRHMDTMKGFNKKAYEWLKKIAPEYWSRSHFLGRANCGLLINNICEVFNRQLLDARDSPTISCLEYVKEYLTKRIVIVQNVIEKCDGP
ncbi:hypothetical protein Tco_1513422, partial [Tanacetum coccineum]